MERICIAIFLLLIVPHLGFPWAFDKWLLLLGILFLAYSVYMFVTTHSFDFNFLEEAPTDGLAQDLQEGTENNPQKTSTNK